MKNGVKKILVVEDEVKILEVIKSYLQSKDYEVFAADNGKEALSIFERENISLIILDLMLPDISGEDICVLIRKKSCIPIIMLTAKVDEENILNGLGIGADDYITKPFSLKQLNARIEAVLRRIRADIFQLNSELYFQEGDLRIDYESRIVKKNNKEVSLTANEFKILAVLIKYPNKVFTREEIILAAFGEEFDGFDRTVDSHIKNLRQKIETDSKNPVYIRTVHGIGYKFGGI